MKTFFGVLIAQALPRTTSGESLVRTEEVPVHSLLWIIQDMGEPATSYFAVPQNRIGQVGAPHWKALRISFYCVVLMRMAFSKLLADFLLDY